MYGQYQHFQQQQQSVMASTTTAMQGALQWNGTAWVSATAAAAAVNSATRSRNNPSLANVAPPNPVATFTRYYHAYQAKVKRYEEIIQRSGPSAVYQSRLDWARYYANESTRAAHHFHNNPNERTAPFSLPPAPVEDDEETKKNTSSTPSSVTTTTEATDESTPGSLERFVQKCIGRYTSDEQKKTMQAKIEQIIARAIQEGNLHSKNWDVEPVPRLGFLSAPSEHLEPASQLKPTLGNYGQAQVDDSSIVSSVTGSTTSHHTYNPPVLNQLPKGMGANARSLNRNQNVGYYGPGASALQSSSNSPSSSRQAKSSFSSLSQKQNNKKNGKRSSYYGPSDDGDLSLNGDFIALVHSNNRKNKKQKKSNNQYSMLDDGMNNSSTTLNKRAARFSGPGGIADVVSSETGMDVSDSNRYMGKGLIGGSLKKLDEQDFENMTVKGTCQKLEKEYLRLTSPPRPELVRPRPVLEQHLTNIKAMRLPESTMKKEYLWFCSQLKAIRQDCTVQRIRDALTVDVYETHAKIALEEGDLNEYNQCQTQLKYLYADDAISKIPGAHKNYEEFVSYRILYYIFLSTNDSYDGGSADFVNIMLSLTAKQRQNNAIVHALRTREAVALGNYHQFFRLHMSCPNLGHYLTERIVPTMRFRALQRIAKSYRPSVGVEFCLKELNFSDAAAAGEAWLKSCGCVVENDKLITKDSTTIHEPVSDNKNSLI